MPGKQSLHGGPQRRKEDTGFKNKNRDAARQYTSSSHTAYLKRGKNVQYADQILGMIFEVAPCEFLTLNDRILYTSIPKYCINYSSLNKSEKKV